MSLKKSFIISFAVIAICLHEYSYSMEQAPRAMTITSSSNVVIHLDSEMVSHSKTLARMQSEGLGDVVPLPPSMHLYTFLKFKGLWEKAIDIKNRYRNNDSLQSLEFDEQARKYPHDELCEFAHYSSHLDIPMLYENITTVLARQCKWPNNIKKCLSNGGYGLDCDIDTQRVIAQKMLSPAAKFYWLLQESMHAGKGALPVIELPAHYKKVCFNKHGTMLAAGSYDKPIRVDILEPKTGVLKRALSVDHESNVCSLAFNDDSSLLAAGSHSGFIFLWNPSTGECVQSVPIRWGRINALCFNAEDPILAAGLYEGPVFFWNLKTQELTSNNKYFRTDALCYDKHGHALVAALNPCEVTVWNTQLRQCIHTLPAEGRGFSAAAFNQDGTMIAARSFNDRCVTFQTIGSDQNSDQKLIMNDCEQDPQESLCFNQDSSVLAVGRGKGSVSLWDLKTKKMIHTIARNREEQAQCVCFSPDDTLLVCAFSNTLRIWQLASKEMKEYLDSRISVDQAGLLMHAYEQVSNNKRIPISAGLVELAKKLPPHAQTAFWPTYWQWLQKLFYSIPDHQG